MRADETYFKELIGSIPKTHFDDIVKKEIMDLLFDCGQRASADDQETIYLINRTTNVLKNQYADWKLSYLDECLRKGKMDEFDKGQKINMKRLEVWFFSYARYLKTAVWKEHKQEVANYMHPQFAAKFADNATRLGPVLRFRQAYKPNFDDDEWTLSKIEQTPEFKRWLKSDFKKQPDENLIFTKIR